MLDPSEVTIAYLALGSNVGDRFAHLQFAVDRFGRSEGVRLLAASAVYETQAHTLDGSEQDPYLNAVVAVATSLKPFSLLRLSHTIEHERGRVRADSTRWAPRTLDIDLLIFGDASIQERELIVPHPRLGERRFVLRPLADIAGGVFVPAPYSERVAALLRSCEDVLLPVRIDRTLTTNLRGGEHA